MNKLFIFVVLDTGNNPHTVAVCSPTRESAIKILLTLGSIKDYDDEVEELDVIQSLPLGIVANN